MVAVALASGGVFCLVLGLLRNSSSDADLLASAPFLMRGALLAFVASGATLLLAGLLTGRSKDGGAIRLTRSQTLSLLLGVTLITLAIGFTLKAPCFLGQDDALAGWVGHANWGDSDQYRMRCYNDIVPLWGVRGMNLHRIETPDSTTGTAWVPDGTNFVQGGSAPLDGQPTQGLPPFPYVQHDGARNGDSDHTPLGFIEYPVLTGVLMWMEAVPSSSGGAFAGWNVAAMSAAALVVTFLLSRFDVPPRRILWWAAGSPLALYAFHNWDLLAVVLGVGGLYMFQRGKFAWSGALLALGTAAKIYPGLFLPILGLELLRRRHAADPLRRATLMGSLALGGVGLVLLGVLLRLASDAPTGIQSELPIGLGALAILAAGALLAVQLRRTEWLFVGGAIGALALVNLPFLLIGLMDRFPTSASDASFITSAHGNVWAMTYTFHVDRGVTFETPWYVLSQMLPDTGDWWSSEAPKFALAVLVASLVAIMTLVARGRLAWLHACTATLALFLLLNKVHSVQYVLWLLPLLALVRMPWWATLAYVLADLWVFWTIWTVFLHGYKEPYLGVFEWAVLARAAGLAAVAGAAVWAGWKRGAADGLPTASTDAHVEPGQGGT